MKRYTFKKEERLCSKRLIDGLFNNGSSFVLYPFRVVFLRGDTADPLVQVLVSVPKRRLRKAVDRNLVRRRIREAFRLQKAEILYPFFEQHDAGILLAIQYVSNEILGYDFIHRRMGDALMKIRHEYRSLYLGEDH